MDVLANKIVRQIESAKDLHIFVCTNKDESFELNYSLFDNQFKHDVVIAFHALAKRTKNNNYGKNNNKR